LLFTTCDITSCLRQSGTTTVVSVSEYGPFTWGTYLEYRWDILEGVFHDPSLGQSYLRQSCFVDIRQCIVPSIPTILVSLHSRGSACSIRCWPGSAVNSVAAQTHRKIDTLEASLSRAELPQGQVESLMFLLQCGSPCRARGALVQA